MSTPEQPANPPLTRKQLREIRNTGATPIIAADVQPEPESEPALDVSEQPGEQTDSEQQSAPEIPEAPKTPAAPFPRAAVPVDVAPAPVADSSVDLGMSPLTRRQARQQERIRTASVPVITPEVAAQHDAEQVTANVDAQRGHDDGLRSVFGTGATPVAAQSFDDSDFAPTVLDEDVSADNEGWRDMFVKVSPEASALAASLVAADSIEAQSRAADGTAPLVESVENDVDARDELSSESDRAVVNPLLGANLLTAKAAESDVPASFDQIFSRSTGAVSTSNALIISDNPATDFGGAVTATGEVLVTGTFQLPEGLGSTGHAVGTADSKETDAVLIDGELPAHSSPTPIAASAAISTVKSAGEVIRPPAPEKGSRLMMALAITAGVLALALVGVLIVAFATGVFS
ncbi:MULTISPECIES: hypothetical protein [Microbacterium]|uniref:Uncharacterized protein n=1 Tax=Microbacterium marmarense TaxID=3122051 RepID=A0ABU8LUY8_9MICO